MEYEMRDKYLSEEYLEKLDKYFRASNYLTVAQLYLMKNPLLREPLKISDVKPRLLGHWGTCTGQNFVYAHCNRVICKNDLNMILISGPGHGGNFFVANSYLEGSYTEFYPEITLDEKGMTKLCKRFSFPGGVSSHVSPEVPGSINEGGELGYSLAHAFGAVLDNPNLIATVVVGDGESETGPLATSWHANKFLNPAIDGAVLPVLHLNGYKINNPTVLSRIPKKELESLFVGYGYKPYFVEGDDPKKLHKVMAIVMDKCIAEIKKIQQVARLGNKQKRIVWPMIILRTPKGWTGPKNVNGVMVEGNYMAHQIPITFDKPENLALLEKWLKSYRPDELFDDNYRLLPEIAEILPKGNRRISSNPHGNGGLFMKELITPKLKDCAVKVSKPGSVVTQDMYELGRYVEKLFELNKDNKNFRIFSPDEAKSNRLHKTFDSENKNFGYVIKTDDHLANDGRIMDSYLSEHMCEGWLEGYILTGRHGMFNSYESFLRVVDSMVAQHAKWLKMSSEVSFRKPISSLNLVLTSNVWQQDHNGYTHQDPGFFDHMANKKPEFVKMYLPADANTLIASYDECSKSKNKINIISASKHPSYQWLNMEEAEKHVKNGVSVWKFACRNDESNPDVVLVGCGATPTLEIMATVTLIKKYLPDLNIRVVNVNNLNKLASPCDHPDGMSDDEFDKLFTTNKPIIFNFHGYARLIKMYLYNRKNKNLHVFGYKEEGTVTTPFDMRVRNEIDRYHLMKVVANNVKLDKKTRENICLEMDKTLNFHANYIVEEGRDIPEVDDWKFIN